MRHRSARRAAASMGPAPGGADRVDRGVRPGQIRGPTLLRPTKAPPVSDTPNLDPAHFRDIDPDALFAAPRSTHPPRILMLYGSLRDRSYSRLMIEEAARVLTRFGAEPRIFDPTDLPAPCLLYTSPSPRD